jgi:hypothetical protein
VVDHAQIAAGRLDMATLQTSEADDIVEDLAVIAGIRSDAQELRIAADASEFRLDLGQEAVARGLVVVERVVVEVQADQRGQRGADRFLDRDRRLAIGDAVIGPVRPVRPIRSRRNASQRRGAVVIGTSIPCSEP